VDHRGEADSEEDGAVASRPEEVQEEGFRHEEVLPGGVGSGEAAASGEGGGALDGKAARLVSPRVNPFVNLLR
jgi:hypothetical protein